jgi:iron complex outermembrane receptor protein
MVPLPPHRVPWPASAAALALVAASPAGAQVPDPLDAVVVTATRAAEPSLKIPASVDRIYADDIRFARPQVNLSETLPRVPGIVVQNRQNYAQDLQISSRGFGARSTFGVRGIRLIADGIPATMPDGQGQAATFDLGTAERIEVLRGPFSTMYGNASGGVINVLTESGPPRPEAWADGYFGSYDTWKAALRFGGTWERFNALAGISRFQTDGYRDHSAAERDQLNAKLVYAMGEATSLTMIVNALDQPESQDPLGLTAAQVEQDPRQASPAALLFDTRKSVRQSQGGLALDHRLAGGDSIQATVYYGARTVNQFLALTGAAPATSSGGVVDLDRDYGGGALRYSRPLELAGGPLRLSVGAEYERMAERRQGFVNDFGVQGALRRDEDDTVWSLNGYAQAEWAFAPEWLALAGVRATRVEFESKDYFITPGNPDDSGSRTFSNVGPALGLLYRLAPAASAYATYGQGFETPTFAELAYRPDGGSGLNFALDPARSQQVEVGLKAILGGRGRVNLAAFGIETEDEIVVATNQGGRATFKNAGRTRRVGFEAAAEARLGAGFEAVAAFTYLDAEYRDPFTTVPAPGGPTVTIPAGNKLPGVPRTYAYGELRWGHPPTGFTAALEVLYKGKVYVNDENSASADAYTVANLALGFVQRGGRWRLSEFVRIDNLFDEQYVGSVIVNATNGRFYEPSPGRNFLVGVQASLAF